MQIRIRQNDHARHAAHGSYFGYNPVCPIDRASRTVRARAMCPNGLTSHKILPYSPRTSYSSGSSPQSMIRIQLSLNWSNADIQSIVILMRMLAVAVDSTASADDGSSATTKDISELTFTPSSTSSSICAAPNTKGSKAANVFTMQS